MIPSHPVFRWRQQICVHLRRGREGHVATLPGPIPGGVPVGHDAGRPVEHIPFVITPPMPIPPQISSNRSLDGVLDTLNSKNMTDAGPLQLIDHENKVGTGGGQGKRIRLAREGGKGKGGDGGQGQSINGWQPMFLMLVVSGNLWTTCQSHLLCAIHTCPAQDDTYELLPPSLGATTAADVPGTKVGPGLWLSSGGYT